MMYKLIYKNKVRIDIAMTIISLGVAALTDGNSLWYLIPVSIWFCFYWYWRRCDKMWDAIKWKQKYDGYKAQRTPNH